MLSFSTVGLAPASAQPSAATANHNYVSGHSAPAAPRAGRGTEGTRLPDGYEATSAQKAEMLSAAAQAKRTGKTVTVEALTSPTQEVVASLKGGFLLDSNTEPVRTQVHGAWKSIDLTLRRNSNGSWSPAAVAYGQVAFSGGGRGALVSTRSGGAGLAVTWPGLLPAPVVSGATATYRDVFPQVDLVVSATSTGGFSDTLVIKSAAAAKNPALAKLKLATQVTGGRLEEAADGGLAVVAGSGQALLEAAAPQVWDSNTKLLNVFGHAKSDARIGADPSDAAHPGLAAKVAQLKDRVSGGALELTADTRMLTSAATVWPIYEAAPPSFNWHPSNPSAPKFDEVKQGCPGHSFYGQTGDTADLGRLGVGYNGWQEGDCAAGDEHAIYQWSLPSVLFGSHIHTATIEATEVYSASCGSGNYTVNLHWSGGIGSGTDWNNRPRYNNYATSQTFGRAWNPKYCSTAGSVSQGFNVYTPIYDDAKGRQSTFAVTLSEDSAEASGDDLGFSRFSDNPALQIYYNLPPSPPNADTMAAVSGSDNAACATGKPYPYMGKTIASTPPSLRAKASDPDGDELQATYQYWIDGTTTKYTVTTANNYSSGSYPPGPMSPSFVSSLTSGQVVDWQVVFTDGEDSTTYNQSPTCHFTAEPAAPDTPTVASVNNTYPESLPGSDTTAGNPAGTAGTFSFSTTSGTTATKFIYNLDAPPATSNPPTSETVTATTNGSTSTAQATVTPNWPGMHTLWVYGVDGAGDVSGMYGYRFLVASHAASTCPSVSACFNNTAISPDSNPGLGNADGSSHSISASDLSSAGWSSGGAVTIDGAKFVLPAYGSGQADNILAANQTVTLNGGTGVSGNALVFLATSTNASFTTPGAIAGDATAPYVPENTGVTGTYCFNGANANAECPASGTVNYSDGTSSTYTLTVPDWIGGPTSIAAVTLPHWNSSGGQTTPSSGPKLYPFAVPITAGKTVLSVTLPDVSQQVGNNGQGLHIFSVAARNTTTASAPSGQTWTGVWANPNEGSYNYQGSNFSNQTFRIAIKPSLSGGMVRIKFDNALGTNPLNIGHATIALSSSASSPSPVPSATPITLKFGGSQSTSIPDGAMVYSDPLAFTVTAAQYVLVSYQLSNSVPYLVEHSYANNAFQYLTATGAGDKTADTTGTPFSGTGTYSGWFTNLVTDVDVATINNVPTQAVLGDGLIDPRQPNTTPTNTAGYRVSDTMAGAEPTTPSPYGTLAEGIESNQLMQDNPETYNGSTYGGPSALSRIDRDILDQPGLSNVIVDEGLEDVLFGNTDNDVLANGYSALLQYLNAWGVSTTLTSLTPCDGFNGDGATPNDPCTSTVDGYRNNINDWLSSTTDQSDPQGWGPYSTPPVYFADFDAAVAVPDTTNGEEKLNPAIDPGDHVNITNAGYAAETTSFLSPHDTWLLKDGTGYTFANDTAATDTPYTIGDTATNVGNSPFNLSSTGATWTNDSTRGEVLSLDGTAGAAASTNTSVINTGHSFSVSAWVNVNSLPTHNASVLAESGTVSSPFFLQYNYGHTNAPMWAFTFTGADAANPSFKGAYTSGVTANTWTHLVGVYNATTGTVQLYVNGNLAASQTGVTPWSATGVLNLGADQYNGAMTDYFPGSVSDLQAWNYALTPNQITALYQQIN
ncbi:LamG-like jellyroll fold domain-containing protein [Streptacidiphilus melanogenes]|uniref:LamG-like jellyroll fold domain-containing protein n=1 Tax=Streptacidiphilus melanogenes TaxID=411235 RepID=UPI001F2792FD|nr:LamG-like jellyroll fold domain-containing protein [Streptacidiphilus melanogenes]